MQQTPLRFGIAGAGGRGAGLAALFARFGDRAKVAALCDIDPDRLAEAAHAFPDASRHLDLEEMVRADAVNAVLIATPMPLHASGSIRCLDSNVHVLCEVPAVVSFDEARRLVRSATASRGRYAMAENYLFTVENRMVRAIAAAGLFGTPYYGRGEYIHELKELNEQTRWRRKWQTGIRGVTYPTHSLGPLLDWTRNDRVVSVSCAGTGSHYRDPRGEPYHDDSATMLCRLASGGLFEIRVDMLSDRPHAMTNYEFQGTDGGYESPRAESDPGRIWLRAIDDRPRWRTLAETHAILVDQQQLSPPEPVPESVGHGGGDFFVLRDFIDSIRRDRAPTTDVHRALDLTLPGIASQAAIADGGWIAVPDSRAWETEPADGQETGQLVMVWPQPAEPPPAAVPAGYELGTLRDGERESYVRLMRRAGFSDWGERELRGVDGSVLPDGLFVVRKVPEGAVVATAVAGHRPTTIHPHGGELGWVATDPDHLGRGLGRAVCAAAVARLRSAGYRRIYLLTDDFRLPAIALYLRLGFRPLVLEGQDRRWSEVLDRLGAALS